MAVASNSDRLSLDGIQILRAVAALAVVVHPAFEQLNEGFGPFVPDWLTTSGAFGVDIFLLLADSL